MAKETRHEPRNVLVTGGAGFVGSNFVRYALNNPQFSGRIINLDKLTQTGNRDNLADVDERFYSNRYAFETADVCNLGLLRDVFLRSDIDTVVHFASESHVGQPMYGPGEFLTTNIIGTFSVLEAARHAWSNREDVRFHHVSTDEVFGPLGDKGRFNETARYDPRTPYSASKASSEHFVRAYHCSHGLPITVSICSSNYGPYQFPEKLIPRIVLNIIEGNELVLHGDGRNARGWVYVEDHCSAIWRCVTEGIVGETYLVGADDEWEDNRLVDALCEKLAKRIARHRDSYKNRITFMEDRPGSDHRSAIDPSKIKRELKWKQSVGIDEGLDRTIDWYLSHPEWVERVRSGAYRDWIEANYGDRD